MKKTMSLLLAAFCLMAAGCRNHGKYFKPYEGGLAADEVRQALAEGGYDMALISNCEDRQVVVYGRVGDSQFLCVETDSLGVRKDTAMYEADADWYFAPLKGGTWRLRHPGITAMSYNAKVARVDVSKQGVRFDLRHNVLTRARCLFLASDAALLYTDTLFARSEVQALLQYVVFNYVDDDESYDAYADYDWATDTLVVEEDAGDYDREQVRQSLKEAEQKLLEIEAGLGDASPCRYHLDALGEAARQIGFGGIEVAHHTTADGSHEGCTFRARVNPCPGGKCIDRMGDLNRMASVTGLSYGFRHAAEGYVHKRCQFYCGTQVE